MLIFLVTFTSCTYYLQNEEKSFLAWMRSTDQFYTGEEYHFRLGIFLTNSRFVREHNKYNKKFSISLNKFAAYTPSEYKSLLNTRFKPSKRNQTTTMIKDRSNSFDWRDRGVVNPIEDMMQCGADWAFSAIQTLETNYAISTGHLEKFSEQHLIDCVTSCTGCSGGDTNTAFQSIIENGGFLCLRKDYAYAAAQGNCKYENTPHVGPVISDYYDVPDGNEEDMAVKIELFGPAAAVVDASNASFQLYASGIYDEPNCDPYILNLSVGVVGYGIENEVKYWIVRNAWGPAWGEKGYMRMVWKHNQCGIASWASVAIL